MLDTGDPLATTPPSGRVIVLDAYTHAVLGKMTVGLSPALGALTPDGKLLYVTNYGSNYVSVIDTRSNIETSKIYTGAGQTGADGVAVSQDGRYAWVTNLDDNNVYVINTRTQSVQQVIPSYNNSAYVTGPNNVGFTPNGKFAYITIGGTDDGPTPTKTPSSPGTTCPGAL